MNLERLLPISGLPALGAVLETPSFSVVENTTALGIALDYVNGAEDGIAIRLRWQYQGGIWFTVGDSTAPGSNAWLPWERTYDDDTRCVFPVPSALIYPGQYIVEVRTLGAVAPTGVLTMWKIEGRRY